MMSYLALGMMLVVLGLPIAAIVVTELRDADKARTAKETAAGEIAQELEQGKPDKT